MKIVCVRLDKIGDLVCTLSADQSLKGDVVWLVQKGMGVVAKAADPKRRAVEIDKKISLKGFVFLWRFINKEKPTHLVSFQSPWWIHFIFWVKRVQFRVGVLSSWHSFLFLNYGVRQKRSESVKHEAQYNWDLVMAQKEIFNIKSNYLFKPLKIVPNPEEFFKPLFIKNKKPYVVVHPGMAGSAKNWSIEQYIKLIVELKKKDFIVITGTKMDERWLLPLQNYFEKDDGVGFFQDQLSFNQLLCVLSQARLVIAPSTGVLHLASSLGVRFIGLYSPIQVQHSRRWGALGEQGVNLLPEVECPAKFKCLGPQCQWYDCMDLISVDQVLTLTHYKISEPF